MPITDYKFENRVFFAVESGSLNEYDAAEWARRLAETAQNSPEPIAALVDARTAISMSIEAERIFIKASYTPNLMAVVVITNPSRMMIATTIKLLGKRDQARICSTEEQAKQHIAALFKHVDTTGDSEAGENTDP